MSFPATASVLLTGVSEIVNLFGSGVTQWAIYATGTSTPAILPDSFASLDFNSDSRSCDYPVEQGGFESYNKVMAPEAHRIQLVCAGRNMQISDFLDQLKSMKESTNLYDVATPDALYSNTTLSRYDYKRTSTNGVTMLTVECLFEEIRQASSPTYSSTNASAGGLASPPTVTSDSESAASPVNQGTISVQDTPPGLASLWASQGATTVTTPQ